MFSFKYLITYLQGQKEIFTQQCEDGSTSVNNFLKSLVTN